MIDVHVLILSRKIYSFIVLKLCDTLFIRHDRDVLCIHLYKNKSEFIHVLLQKQIMIWAHLTTIV